MRVCVELRVLLEDLPENVEVLVVVVEEVEGIGSDSLLVEVTPSVVVREGEFVLKAGLEMLGVPCLLFRPLCCSRAARRLSSSL